MKILFLITITFLTSLSLYSQEPIKIPEGLQYSKDKINQDEWNLVDYQFKVDEIQTKIDYVKNNPEENEKAIANNWYDMAYKTLAAAKYERNTHIEKYEYKKIPGFPQHTNTGNRVQDDAIYEKNIVDWIHAHPLTTKDHGQ